MKDEFGRAKDLFMWNARLFGFLGVWPLESTYGWFAMCSVYIVAHLITEGADLYCVRGDFALIVENLSTSALQVMIFIKMLRLRFTKKIVTVLELVIDGIDTKRFDSRDEKRIYLAYNHMAKKFFKVWVVMGVFSAVGYWLKPLQLRLQAAQNGESPPFILPYRVRLFFEVNDSTTYHLVWIYQAPVTYFGIWHAVAIAFVVSLVLHVCGLLAVLVFRVKNINLGNRDSPEDFRSLFQDIANRHRGILKLVNAINDVFGLILLEELVITTVLIGLTCYVALTSLESDTATDFIPYLMYCVTLLFLIYGYCAAGECLIIESTNLHTAYYHCLWYDMSSSFKKQLMICMVATSKPIHLTAGGIYALCLFNFMGIVKTAAGYISMLRSMI